MRFLAAAACFSAIFASPIVARAFERQHHVGVDLGLSMLSIDGKSSLDLGGGVGAHYTYGLTDQFNFVVEGSYSRVALSESSPGSPHTLPTGVSHLGVGVMYVLDVLQWVPYFGLVGGGYLLSGGTLDNPKLLPGIELGLGLDYQLNRSFAVGVAGRQTLLITEMSTYPSFTNVFARCEYIWGW
jgi:hypothetical protein